MIDVITINYNGQIVLPENMKNSFKKGEKLLLIKEDERIVLRKVNKLTSKMKEDLEFAQRTEEAWQRYKRGEFISMDGEEFTKEIEKW